MVSVPVCFFHPCYRRKIPLHIEFFHTGASFFIGPCTPQNTFSLTVDVVFCWFQFDFIFLGVYAYIVFCASVKFIFVVGSIGNTEGVFFNVVTW